MSTIACLRQSALVGVNCPNETRILTSPSAAIVRRTGRVRLLVDTNGIAASLF